jgi:RNA recognition motif-containing protein
MATEEAAQAAKSAMNGKMVDQRELKVDNAKPRPERDRGPRW